jgi:predicted DNA-binding WGR domain protein
MAGAKAWKLTDSGAPKYTDDFDIVKRAVLQVTDIANNNNEYYGIELHQAKGLKGNPVRVFTHDGRTDDLETNPDAGAKEVRYFDTLAEAESEYQKIYKSKTGASKGYKEVALASSRIGSQRARGGSSGAIDDKTLAKICADLMWTAYSLFREREFSSFSSACAATARRRCPSAPAVSTSPSVKSSTGSRRSPCPRAG